jgi:hypothetical protein
MNAPARTGNAVVAGADTPCWPGTRRHERLRRDEVFFTIRTYGGHPATLRPPV